MEPLERETGMDANATDMNIVASNLLSMVRSFRAFVGIYQQLVQHEDDLHPSLQSDWAKHALLLRRAEFPARVLIRGLDPKSDPAKSNGDLLYHIDQQIRSLVEAGPHGNGTNSVSEVLGKVLRLTETWEIHLLSRHTIGSTCLKEYCTSAGLEQWIAEMTSEFEKEMKELAPLFENPNRSRYASLVHASSASLLYFHFERAMAPWAEVEHIAFETLYWSATLVSLDLPPKLKKVAKARLRLMQDSIRSFPPHVRNNQHQSSAA